MDFCLRDILFTNACLLAARTFGSAAVYRMPLAPPGSTRVPVHVKPSARSTWSPHAVYLDPATNRYRFYRVYIWDTSRERISDTLVLYDSPLKTPCPPRPLPTLYSPPFETPQQLSSIDSQAAIAKHPVQSKCYHLSRLSMRILLRYQRTYCQEVAIVALEPKRR
jgi:hypothetical protein